MCSNAYSNRFALRLHPSTLQLMGSALYALGDFEGAKAALKQSLR